MRVYLDLMRDILDHGVASDDRTGTGTVSVFGRQIRFDLAEGFPAVTTKRLYFRGVVGELIWFLRGETNIGYLNENRIHIWDEWATEDGELGPVYGKMWRAWPLESGEALDQLSDVVAEIKSNPSSRRLIVSAWNPALLPDPKQTPQANAAMGLQALPPCHTLFQFYVRDSKLSCQLYQRSCDVFLGLPFNIASYALLTHIIAAEAGLGVGDFVWTGGDVHLYSNHLDQVHVQLDRQPRPLPKLVFDKKPSIYNYEIEDFSLDSYDPHPAIKADISV